MTMKTTAALKASALIGAAIVLALLTVQGTLASWTANTTTESQTVQTGDFKVTATVAGTQQLVPAGGTITVAGVSGLKPGDSTSTPIVVTNESDAGGTFTVRTTATLAPATGPLAPYLDTSLALGQDGKCSTLTQGRTTVLDKGASATFCLKTTLKTDTPVTLGGTGASIALTFDTEQQPR